MAADLVVVDLTVAGPMAVANIANWWLPNLVADRKRSGGAQLLRRFAIPLSLPLIIRSELL